MGELKTENLLDYLAEFACGLKFEDLSGEVVREAKRRLFDSLGCLIMSARHDEAVKSVRNGMAGKEWQTQLFNGLAVGMEGPRTLEDAAYLNTHAIRALDWNDTYLSEEPAHPSDNIGALFVLPGNPDGKKLITSLVLAYEIQCRFCDAACIREEGWDHTYYLRLSSAFGIAKMLGLSKEKILEAASLSLTDAPLRQGRTGSQLSPQKALYAAQAVRKGVEAARLAACGITGPSEILEGEYGFIKQCLRSEKWEVRSEKLVLSAFENLGSDFKILTTHIKLYPVEYHAQAVVEAGLFLRKHFEIDEIERIKIKSYEAAKNIIGKGRAARRPATKESADHSLFYILALTLLQGKMTLDEFRLEYLRDARVWGLIDKMEEIEEIPEYTKAYKNRPIPEFPVHIIIYVQNGWAAWEVKRPKGHFANPLSDDELKNKFGVLLDQLNFIWDLENINARDLYWTLRGVEV